MLLKNNIVAFVAILATLTAKIQNFSHHIPNEAIFSMGRQKFRPKFLRGARSNICCRNMLPYDAHARAYKSKRNQFSDFSQIGRKFGFFEKKTYVYVNLSRLKRVPDGQKCNWCYFGVNFAKKQHCCFCCYFFHDFSFKSIFYEKKTAKPQKSEGAQKFRPKFLRGGPNIIIVYQKKYWRPTHMMTCNVE